MKNKTVIIIFIVYAVIGCFFFMNSSKNKKEYEYKVIEEYYTNSDGEKIYTRLYRPVTNEKVPIVIYSHGLGATYRAATDYAIELAKLGVATLSFDFRGGSSRSNSDGLTTNMSILTECDDLEFLLNKVNSFDFVDKDRIILMGSSQGGAVSALVSAKHNDIKGVVLLYPALSIPSYLHTLYINLDEVPESLDYTTDNITLGKKYISDVWDLNVYNEVKNDNKNILIIHGTDDKVVPINHSRELNKIYKNSKLYEIKGADHGFTDKYFDKAIKQIIKYLEDIDVIR